MPRVTAAPAVPLPPKHTGHCAAKAAEPVFSSCCSHAPQQPSGRVWSSFSLSLPAKLCMAIPPAAPSAVANSSTQCDPLPITGCHRQAPNSQGCAANRACSQLSSIARRFPTSLPSNILAISLFSSSFNGLLLPTPLWVSRALLGQTIY